MVQLKKTTKREQLKLQSRRQVCLRAGGGWHKTVRQKDLQAMLEMLLERFIQGCRLRIRTFD